jgi:hypothetical protein
MPEGKLNEVNKKHFLKLIKDELKSIIGQKKYVKKALQNKKLENWERKEFEAIWPGLVKREKELIMRQRNVAVMKEKKNKGLWYNIHKKRKKGEKPAKPGDKNYPKTLDIEGKLTEGKETIFDVATRVMKDKQSQNYKSKKGMVKVDMQSANLLTKVFKKVNPKMKQILSKLGYDNPAGLMKTLWAVVK